MQTYNITALFVNFQQVMCASDRRSYSESHVCEVELTSISRLTGKNIGLDHFHQFYQL